MRTKAEDIVAFCAAFSGSQWREARIEIGDAEIFVSKDHDAEGMFGLSTAMSEQETDEQNGPGDEAAEAELIRSPLFGTLRLAGEDGAPFFAEGQQKEEGAIIAAIEVLGEREFIKTPVAGIVTGIHATPDALIDFDAPVLSISRSS